MKWNLSSTKNLSDSALIDKTKTWNTFTVRNGRRTSWMILKLSICSNPSDGFAVPTRTSWIRASTISWAWEPCLYLNNHINETECLLAYHFLSLRALLRFSRINSFTCPATQKCSMLQQKNKRPQHWITMLPYLLRYRWNVGWPNRAKAKLLKIFWQQWLGPTTRCARRSRTESIATPNQCYTTCFLSY